MNYNMDDLPNWAGVILSLFITFLIYRVDKKDNQRYQKNQEYQYKKDQEMNQRFEEQIGYTVELVESIKSTLGERERTVFKESMKSFIFKKFHEYLTKFVNLWEQYKQNEMMRIGHRMEDEIDIIAQNMRDLIAKSELEITTGELEPFKNLAVGYDDFAHRIAYIGDREEFTREGEELYQKTNELKEIVKEKIQNS